MTDSDIDLEVLLRSPLDDDPSPFPWGAVVVIALAAAIGVGGFLALRSDGDDATVATDGAEQPGATVAGAAPDEPPSGNADGETVAPVTTTVALGLAGYPSPRFAADMTAVPDLGVVMFGGSTPTGIEAEGTWLWGVDDRSWFELETLDGPAPRVMSTFEYVDSLGGVVMFGGGSSVQLGTACVVGACREGFRDDLWLLDPVAATWTELSADGGPGPLFGAASAYDPDSDLLVLFGGIAPPLEDFGAGDLRGETWTYAPGPGVWENLGVLDGPSPRVLAQMVHDPASGSLYLWGGRNYTVNDPPTGMWTFDASTSTWVEAPNVGGESPALRYHHVMDLDPVSGTFVMAGGQWFEGPERMIGENVWTYDPAGGNWRRGGPYTAGLPTAAATGDGGLLDFTDGTERYDIATSEWEILVEGED